MVLRREGPGTIGDVAVVLLPLDRVLAYLRGRAEGWGTCASASGARVEADAGLRVPLPRCAHAICPSPPLGHPQSARTPLPLPGRFHQPSAPVPPPLSPRPNVSPPTCDASMNACALRSTGATASSSARPDATMACAAKAVSHSCEPLYPFIFIPSSASHR